MPVLRHGWDITSFDTKQAAATVLTQIEQRSEIISFHWFRSILKTPTWHLNLQNEVMQQNHKVEFLDAPTFFELYRIYLKQNKIAASGQLESNIHNQ